MKRFECRHCGDTITKLEIIDLWVAALPSGAICPVSPDTAHVPGARPVPATESAIPPLLDFVPEPEDETWMKTYLWKPAWWDDDTEPRCDYCGIHCEDTNIDARGGWCGYCGRCGDHCECLSVLD